MIAKIIQTIVLSRNIFMPDFGFMINNIKVKKITNYELVYNDIPGIIKIVL